MSQAFIVPTNTSVQSASSEYALLGFRSIIPGATVVGAAEDSDHPFTFCTDFQDDTQYSPLASSGSVTIEVRRNTNEIVNFFGMAIHNAFDAGLTGGLDRWDGAAWVEITTFGCHLPRSFLSAQCTLAMELGSQRRHQWDFSRQSSTGWMR